MIFPFDYAADRASRDAEVAELRRVAGAVSEEFGFPKGVGPAPGEIKRILSDLRQQLAEAGIS